MKRKVVKAWAIVGNMKDGRVALNHYEAPLWVYHLFPVYYSKEEAVRQINTQPTLSLSVVPASISYELPRKASKKV